MINKEGFWFDMLRLFIAINLLIGTFFLWFHAPQIFGLK